MIYIYIESGIKRSKKKTTNEYDFIEKFITHHFPGKSLGTDYALDGWDGKDRWEEFSPILNQHTDLNDKNLIIFDADYPNTKGGFEARKSLYESHKITYHIDFDLFLWPNNQEDGDFEIMLEKITQPNHQCVLRSFEAFEKSIDAYNKAATTPIYHTPNQKNKIYTYISSIIKTPQEEKDFPNGYWAFNNNSYWNLDNTYLNRLHNFFVNCCGW